MHSSKQKGWDIEFFPAVTPPSNHEEFAIFKQICKYSFDPKLIKGEVGCALSHLLLWETVLRNQIDYALIFEDDAIFQAQPNELLLYQNVDFQMINAHSNPANDTLPWIGPKSSGLYGYVVSNAGAQKALQCFQTINLPLDIMILKNSILFGGSLRVAVSKPIVSHDDSSLSTIGNQRILFSGRNL